MKGPPEFPSDKLARWTRGRWTATPTRGISGFAVDTRGLHAGELFVALRTDRRDGHEFLDAARAAGASGALVSRENQALALPQLVVDDPLAAFQAIARNRRREFAGSVVGVTGSAGKTSTKNLLALLLGGTAEDSPVLATEGNLNNHLGVPLTLTRLDPARHRHAVVEAGISGPGEMAVLAAMIEPDICVVTLVAPAHLSGIGGIEDVAREKAVLAAAVRPGGMAFFPPQCLEFAAFRALATPATIVGFTAVQEPSGTRVTLADLPEEPFPMRRVSRGMAQNAALALAVALRLGNDPARLRERLKSWEPAPLRGEVRREDGRLLYLDCYNANPASMADALEAFDGIAPRGTPRLYVIGCMEELGADAQLYHRELGRSLRLGPADLMFAIGGHATALREGAVEAGNSADQIVLSDGLDPVADRLSGFRGSVFVKGSRLHRLERLFETHAQLPHNA